MRAMLDGRPSLPLLNAISHRLGWTYTLSWSLSFYPQVILNYRRKSITGLSIDYTSLNVLGNIAYTLYTALFLGSSYIRRQYDERDPGAKPLVRVNDLVFAAHALIICLITWWQCYFCGYTKDRGQRLSWFGWSLWAASAVGVAIVCTLAATSVVDWIDAIYGISYVKLVVTFSKFIPQAYINFRRKSTSGWSIHNMLFDLAGGILSTGQLFLDAYIEQDWEGINGNPAKLWLGIVSMAFDLLFIVQHYILYGDKEELGERTALLQDEGEDGEA